MSNLVLPSMCGFVKYLSAGVDMLQPWDGMRLQAKDLRPDVVASRKVLHDNMDRRWKTEMPGPLKRFHFISTICNRRAPDRRTFCSWESLMRSAPL